MKHIGMEIVGCGERRNLSLCMIFETRYPVRLGQWGNRREGYLVSLRFGDITLR